MDAFRKACAAALGSELSERLGGVSGDAGLVSELATAPDAATARRALKRVYDGAREERKAKRAKTDGGAKEEKDDVEMLIARCAETVAEPQATEFDAFCCSDVKETLHAYVGGVAKPINARVDDEDILQASVLTLQDDLATWLVDNSGSALFVRSCFGPLLSTIVDKLDISSRAEEKRRVLSSAAVAGRMAGPRVLLTGTPGCGTSEFGSYLLLQLLRSQRDFDLIVDLPDGTFAVVSPDGRVSHRKLDRNSAPAEMRNPRNLYVFDARKDDKPFAPEKVQCRALVISSPNEEEFGSFGNKAPITLVMPLWSREELDFCRQLCFPEVTQEAFALLYDKWGGVPRWTLANSTPDETERPQAKLEGMNFETAKQFVGSKTIFVKGDQIVHTVMHCEADAKFKLAHVKFASRYVTDFVLSKLGDKAEAECKSFLIGKQGNAVFAGLYGNVFEWYLHRQLAAGVEIKQSKIRELRPAIGGLAPAPLAADERARLGQFARPAGELKADGNRFDKFGEVADKKSGYWIPRASNFAVIDAFAPPNRLCQMTVSVSHGALHAPLESYVKALKGDVALLFFVPGKIAADFGWQHYLTATKAVHKSVSKEIRSRVRQFVVEWEF